ncbi:MAG: TIM barrel protein, partial [Candidatus Nitrosopolaris sp.]
MNYCYNYLRRLYFPYTKITFGSKIIHIHWDDNHGRKDEHLPIGEGLIDHEKAVRALKDIGYDRTITLEVFT